MSRRRRLEPPVVASIQKATALTSAGSLAWRGTRAVRSFPGLVFLFLPVLLAVVFQIKCRNFSFLLMKSISSAYKLRQWRFWRIEICAAKILKFSNKFGYIGRL
jgi:hypothetical protein